MRTNAIHVLAFLTLLASVDAAAQPRRRPPPPTPAGPQSPMPMPPDPAMERAREAYDRGRARYQAGQWAEALAAFREAHEARPHPTVLLSIAECQDKLGQVHEAVATLEQYLAESPQARDRDAVTTRIEGLRARPASVHVTSEPSGARVEIDGQDTDRTTPADLEVPPGLHTIRLRLDGREDEEQQVTLEYAERREVALTLEVRAPPPRPDLPPLREHHPIVRSFTSTWIAAGVTGVALITGGVLGALTLSKKAEYDDGPTFELANQGDRLALGADIAFGVALAAGLTTVFAYVIASESQPDEDTATRVGQGAPASFHF